MYSLERLVFQGEEERIVDAINRKSFEICIGHGFTGQSDRPLGTANG